MTIREYLTPHLFDLIVLCYALLANATILAAIGGLLEDVRLSPRTRASIFGAGAVSISAWLIGLALAQAGAIARPVMLKPNPYDVFVPPPWCALSAFGLGLLAGILLYLKPTGSRPANALAAVVSTCGQAAAALVVVLWIINQA